MVDTTKTIIRKKEPIGTGLSKCSAVFTGKEISTLRYMAMEYIVIISSSSIEQEGSSGQVSLVSGGPTLVSSEKSGPDG